MRELFGFLPGFPHYKAFFEKERQFLGGDEMKFCKCFKIYLALVVFTLLCPSMSWATWQVVFYDDFDDGNYDGWSVTYPKTGDPAEAPDVVEWDPINYPGKYSIRGVGSGYSGSGLNVYISQPLSISNSSELKIEMRAKSGPELPNSAQLFLLNGTDTYGFLDYGESAQKASLVDPQGVWHDYPINANVWHNFAWTRDADGWWSLNIDGLNIDDEPEWVNFQDNQLTSFDQISLHLLRNQSEIEWLSVSVPEPATILLLGLGGLILRRKYRAK